MIPFGRTAARHEGLQSIHCGLFGRAENGQKRPVDRQQSCLSARLDLPPILMQQPEFGISSIYVMVSALTTEYTNESWYWACNTMFIRSNVIYRLIVTFSNGELHDATR